MSRRQLLVAGPRFEAFIGWDPSLHMFFFQGYDHDKREEDNPVLWLGAMPPFYPELDDLLAQVPNFKISRKMLEELLKDKLFDRLDHG